MSDNHPSLEELRALSRGDLSTARSSTVMRHLMEGCESCRSAVPAPLALLLGVDPTHRRPTPEEDAAYDEAIGRAIGITLKQARHLTQEYLRARKAVSALESGGLESVEKVAGKVRGLALYEALLARSWASRHEDPGLMIQYAKLAIMTADGLDARRYSPERVTDFRCRAWAELGNAFRTADRLDQADAALARATELYTNGTGDRFLGIRLLELQASLAADRRRFPLASKILSLVYRFYRRHGHVHATGRVLISQGLYTGYSGDLDGSLRLLRSGLSLIDETREPILAFAAVHNQVLFLVDAGNFREARKILFKNRTRFLNSAGKINELKLRWLEGRINAGMSRSGQAERLLNQVREGLQEAGLGYQAAIASLDVAAILLPQGRADEAQTLALSAARTFGALHIEREAMLAVMLLRQSFEVRLATASLVEEVAAFLRRIENDPTARFEPR